MAGDQGDLLDAEADLEKPAGSFVAQVVKSGQRPPLGVFMVPEGLARVALLAADQDPPTAGR